MSPVRARVWNGTRFVDQEDFEDPFILGVTMPRTTLIDASALPQVYKDLAGGADTAGLLPDVELTEFTDFAGTSSGRKVINGTSSLPNPRVIANKVINGPILRAATGLGNVRFVNCLIKMNSPWTQTSGGAGPAYVGLADARTNSGTDRWTFERCHFDPGEEFAHPGISAIMGHHLTAYRCTWQRVVDGYSGYRLNGDPSTVLAAEILGCVNVWNSHFWDMTTAGVVHTQDYQTHNDFIQIQGGGSGDGYTYALDARGNLLIGYNFAPDGVTIAPTGIPQGYDAARHLAHQGVLLQQNQLKNVPITSRVSHNWVGGWHQPFTFKTSGTSNGTVFNGTQYDVTMEGNRLVEDDQRLNGSSADFYGVSGGHTYLTRIDPSILLNGMGTTEYPNDLVARAMIEGDNRFADTTNIHANRRGQLLTVRRDATWV